MSYELGGLLGAIGMLILGAAGYGKLQNQVESLKKNISSDQQNENSNLWREIGKRRTDHEEYVKTATERRIEFERELSRVRESQAKWDGKLDTILEKLNALAADMNKMELALGKNDGRS